MISVDSPREALLFIAGALVGGPLTESLALDLWRLWKPFRSVLGCCTAGPVAEEFTQLLMDVAMPVGRLKDSDTREDNATRLRIAVTELLEVGAWAGKSHARGSGGSTSTSNPSSG